MILDAQNGGKNYVTTYGIHLARNHRLRRQGFLYEIVLWPALSCRVGHQAKLSHYTPMEIEIALLRSRLGEVQAYTSE